MDNRSIFSTANHAPKMARFVGISTARFRRVFSYTLVWLVPLAALPAAPAATVAHSVRELEGDHAGDDEGVAEPAPEAARVAEKPHPHQEGSGGADAGPNRIGGAERNVPLRQKQQAAADRERDDRHRRADDGPPRLLRPLQADRPADLAQSGGNQICPGDCHVLRPLPLAIRGTIAKDDSRFVTAGSAPVRTAGGAGRQWRMARAPCRIA